MKRATKTRRQLIALACLLLITGCLSWRAYLDATDPSFNGKRVSSWLAELEGNEFSDASVAIYVMGDRAMPQIVRYLKAHDGTWHPAPGSLLGKALRKFGYLSAAEKQKIALKAIKILKQQAAPLADDLVDLLDDKKFNSSINGPYTNRWTGQLSYSAFSNGSFLLDSFASLGSEGELALIRGLKRPSLAVRLQCVELLLNLESSAAVEALIDTLKSDEAEMRGSAAHALSVLAPEPRSVALEIAPLLADQNARYRLQGVNALGYLVERDESLLPAILPFAVDPSADVRRSVFRRLAYLCIGHPEAMDAIVSGLRSQDVITRQMAVFALLEATEGFISSSVFGEDWHSKWGRFDNGISHQKSIVRLELVSLSERPDVIFDLRSMAADKNLMIATNAMNILAKLPR